MGVSQTTRWGWPGTTILLISASQITRITGVSHQYPGQILKREVVFNMLVTHTINFLGETLIVD
jgi:hypothetical protein